MYYLKHCCQFVWYTARGESPVANTALDFYSTRLANLQVLYLSLAAYRTSGTLVADIKFDD